MGERSSMLEELREENDFLSELVCVDSLKNKKEFDIVYKKGVKRYTKFFTLYALDLNEKSFFHRCQNHCDFLLGLSVSKKIGKAVQRNFIKRRIRFMCRKQIDKLKNYAIIFVVKEGIDKISYQQMEQDFLQCLRSYLGVKSK